ncbi:Hypothetical protein A7982_04260 [Minicystis rosea]|nr:Hypothetical protein A7982_04260 [Minicystis rosea]
MTHEHTTQSIMSPRSRRDASKEEAHIERFIALLGFSPAREPR